MTCCFDLMNCSLWCQPDTLMHVILYKGLVYVAESGQGERRGGGEREVEKRFKMGKRIGEEWQGEERGVDREEGKEEVLTLLSRSCSGRRRLAASQSWGTSEESYPSVDLRIKIHWLIILIAESLRKATIVQSFVCDQFSAIMYVTAHHQQTCALSNALL